MIVVASGNGAGAGMAAAIEVLRAGGSALDAVEAGCRAVEADPSDHSVGVGGWPNLIGAMEMDASIMEGTTRRAGAVGALGGFPHAISVARAVLEKLPRHLLLVGDGAARWARECGFVPSDPLTEEAARVWRERVAPLLPDGWEAPERVALGPLVRLAQDPERIAGTVNFLARDAAGRLASAVSTSGWGFKYPGRVGDSAVIGAGNYCDDRWGACACTGIGEWAIRSGTAQRVVSGLRDGVPLGEACARAMRDLSDLPLPADIDAAMHLVALTPDGRHAGFTTHPGTSYVWQTSEMTAAQVAARTVV